MDARNNTVPGYDAECVPIVNPGGLTEDYIMIPKAVVTGTQELRANTFCSNSITGQEITCKYRRKSIIFTDMLMSIFFFEATARGPFVIEVNTDTKTSPNMETGFRFRYKIV